MKAFISFSVNDNNQNVITLLANQLRNNNFIISTSLNFLSHVLDFKTFNEINESNLFIGIITENGQQATRVITEWNYAKSAGIPNLLLIEDTIQINTNFDGNYIRFNRFYPDTAIKEIESQMKPETSSNSSDILPWILGGAALIAIIALFSNDKKK